MGGRSTPKRRIPRWNPNHAFKTACSTTDLDGMPGYQLVCIGCGPAGETAAVTAAQHGLRTLVVEAAQKSGSLITARLAAEQGREVFAIPGSIHNPLARGCHALIRQGAKLVETAADVIEELPALFGTLNSVSAEASDDDQSERKNWDPDYRQLFEFLGFDPISVDNLVELSGLTADKVSSMLLLLELEGYVSSAPGGRYHRTGQI